MQRRAFRVSPRFFFSIVTVLVFITVACWTVASPLVAAPDEQAHMMHAYALDHGQMGGRTADPAIVTYTVPQSIAWVTEYPGCWHFHPTIGAGCAGPWNNSSAPVATTDYVGHYPPLYYAIVGVSTWVSASPFGLYLMRFLSGALSAIMIGLAAYVIARYSRRRSLIFGLYLAFTPQVWFLASAVNPSGFEITTALAFWTTLCVVALEYRENAPRPLLVLLGVEGVTFELIRGLSPLWVFVAGLVAIFLFGPRTAVDQLRARRDYRLLAGALTAGALVAVTWILTQGTLNVLRDGIPVPASDSTLTVIHIILTRIPIISRESVGILGWIDTNFPTTLYHVWWALAVIVVLAGLVRGGWRERASLVFLVACALLIPLGIIVHEAKRTGIVWQGRDGLPLVVGVVLVGAALCLRSGSPDRIVRWLLSGGIAAVWVMNLVAFFINLKRYAVGVLGPDSFILHGRGWSPPTGQLPTLAVFTVSSALLAGFLIWWTLSGTDTTTVSLPRRQPAA